jgi:uncharacterized protein (TIGR02996 family)
MDPRDALLAAIRENMDDDLPRLAYADWLEENGEPELAEFIRVECRLAGMPDTHPERRALFRRDLELLSTFSASWIGPVRQGCSFWEVRRGFLDEISTTADHFLRHAEAIARRHPLRIARLSVTEEDLVELASCPHLLGVRELTLTGPAALADEVARAVARSSHLDWLDALRLDGLPVGPAGARALAGAEHLGRLRALRLHGAEVGPAGGVALVESPRLPRLEALDLTGRYSSQPVGSSRDVPNIDEAGVVRLALCPGAARLRVLMLAHNRLGDEGLRALSDSPYLGGLQALYLEFTEQMSAPARNVLEARFGGAIRHGWGW